MRVLLQSVRGSASFTGATRAGPRTLSARKIYYVRAPRASVQLRNARGEASAPTARCGSPAAAARSAARHGRQRARNGVYRGAMDFSPGRSQRRRRGQLAPARHLRARRGGRRVAALVAARGAEGAGRGGAHLRDHDHEADRGLRRLPRHALAGLRRRRGRGGLDRRGRRPRRAARSSPTTASPSSPTSSPPRAGAPRTSRTRRSATSRGRGSSRSTTPTTTRRRATAGGRSSCRSSGRRASSAALVKGKFRGIQVVQRGVSPRIVEADVVGTAGRTRVTGGSCGRASASTTRGRSSPRSPAARRRRRTSRPPRRPAAPTRSAPPPTCGCARSAR